MASENEGSSFLTGLLVGGIIGAVLGLLFAPQPGATTRSQIRARADEFASLGKSAWEEGKEAATQRSEELKEKMNRVRRRGE